MSLANSIKLQQNKSVDPNDLCTKKAPPNDQRCFLLSARRDSNPRPRPWEGRAPPTEPLAHKTCTLKTAYHKIHQTSLSDINVFSYPFSRLSPVLSLVKPSTD